MSKNIEVCPQEKCSESHLSLKKIIRFERQATSNSIMIALTEPLRSKFKIHSKDEAEYVELSKLPKYTSKQIHRLFLTLKRLINWTDKVTLDYV